MNILDVLIRCLFPGPSRLHCQRCVVAWRGRRFRHAVAFPSRIRRCTGTHLLRDPLGVQLQQPREHLVADGVGPAVAVGLLLAAPRLLVDRVVEQEVAVGRDVAPAVGVEDGAVQGGV